MVRSVYQRTVLIAVILSTVVDFCQPCISLLDGWKQKSVGERAKLAKVVFLGKTVRRYPLERMDDKTEMYAADFKIIRLFKGQQIVEEVLERYPSPFVKVYGFGEKRKCLVEVYPDESYLVFMVYHPASRSLVARYDDIFGATATATEENENEILAEMGWKPWSPWTKCSKKCGDGWQSRERQCTRKSCEGRDKNRETRHCNMYDCYGIKDLVEFFISNQTADTASNSIYGPGNKSSRRGGQLKLHNGKMFSAPASSIFQYYFPEHAFSIVTTFKLVRKPFGVYLVSVYDAKGTLVLGIKLFGGTIILEYANGRGFVVFDVDMPVGKWQRMAVSVKDKQATLYWNCEKSGTKTITKEFSFASYAKGILHLGELGRGYHRYKMEINLEELYFIPDEKAAKEQCQPTPFDSAVIIGRKSPEGSGYGPDDEESSGATEETNEVEEAVEASWSEWSPCSHTCGAGRRKRVMMCNLETSSKPAVECLKALQTQEIKNCYIQDCPAHCSQPCLNGGICLRNNKCKCRPGYHGDRCQKVVCGVRCLNGGACNAPDTCVCPKGYSGRRCEQVMCNPQCRHGGRCISPNRCHCLPGFSPPTCTPICNPPCMNGGLCAGHNTCICRRGFIGRRCMKAVCSSRCLNGGFCYAPNTCSCPYGWQGRRCEKARCYEKCRNRGTCIRRNVCLCHPGYKGYRCQALDPLALVARDNLSKL